MGSRKPRGNSGFDLQNNRQLGEKGRAQTVLPFPKRFDLRVASGDTCIPSARPGREGFPLPLLF